MKKRGKIIATISTLCLALVMLTVSVLAATSVSFNIGGSVSYIIEDVYVEFEARVYSTSKHFASDEELATTSEAIASSNFDAINAKTKLNDSENYTFNKEQIKNTSNPSVWSESNEDYFDYYSSVTGGEHTPLDIDLAYSTTNEKLTYFVIIEVTNLSSETVYAYVNTEGDNALAFPENSWTYRLEDYETLTSENATKYMVFAFGLKDMTLGIESSDFNLPIIVTMDEPDLVVPMFVLDNVVVDKQAAVATSAANATNHEVNVQTVGSTQLLGMDFNLDEETSGSDNITVSFQVWLKGISVEYVEMGLSENVTPFQLFSLDAGEGYTIEQYLSEMSDALQVYPDLIANYTSSSVALTSDDGLVLSAELDENNVETYTLTIPKSSISENFSIMFHPNALQTLLVFGGNINFDNLLTNTEDLQTSWKTQAPAETYKINGNAITFTTSLQEIVLDVTPEYKYLVYSVPFKLVNIPEEVDNIKLTVLADYLSGFIGATIANGTVTDGTNFLYGSVECPDQNSNSIDGMAIIDIPRIENINLTLLCGTLSPIDYEVEENLNISFTINFDEPEQCKFGYGSVYTYTDTSNGVFGLSDFAQDTENIIIPELTPLNTIAYEAFKGESGIKSISIPNTIKAIGYRAFSGCTGITSITIPDNVTWLGYDVFNGWTAEQSIYFEGTALPEDLDANWRNGCQATIYINGKIYTGE